MRQCHGDNLGLVRPESGTMEIEAAESAYHRSQFLDAVSGQVCLETWNEDETPFRRFLLLDAVTFKQTPVFDLPPVQPDQVDQSFLVSPEKRLAYQNRVLPRGHPLELLGRKGFVLFDGEVVLPTLIDLRVQARTGEPFLPWVDVRTRVSQGAVWMSLTPSEMLTQRSGVQMASGKVVIGGLGLGWLLRKVCEKEGVDEVIVVEKSAELLEWYGRELCSRYTKVKDVICDDVYRHLGKHGRDTKYLLDIWFCYQDARRDRRLLKFRRRMKKALWAWGLN